MATPGGYGYTDNWDQEDTEMDNPVLDDDSLLGQTKTKQPGCHCQIPQSWTTGHWVLWWICLIIVIGGFAGITGGTVSVLLNKFKDFEGSIRDIPAVSTNGELAWISIGQFATGFIAIGQFAFGFITIGQCTLGFISISATGIGLLFSIGMVTASCGFVIAMVSVSGYTFAGMLTLSLLRARHAMIGVQLLYPFYGDDECMFSGLFGNGGCCDCQGSQSDAQYDYLEQQEGSFHTSPAFVVTINGSPVPSHSHTNTHHNFHHHKPYNPHTDPFSALNPNNPNGIAQTNQRMHQQIHQDNMNRMHQNNQRMHQQMHQTNMNNMHRQTQMNHQTHMNNMNRMHQNTINHNNHGRRF